jgi:hypothetical protein
VTHRRSRWEISTAFDDLLHPRAVVEVALVPSTSPSISLAKFAVRFA